MLSVTLVCVGRLKEPFYRDAAAEYQKRLRGSCRLEVVEVPEQKLPAAPTLGQIQAALEREQDAVSARIPRGSRLVALCVEGDALSSEELARTMGRWMVDGSSALTFVVGGSYGLSPRLKRRADLRLSLSRMTFPHHLARVVLLEQLYRAFQIQAGGEYHK